MFNKIKNLILKIYKDESGYITVGTGGGKLPVVIPKNPWQAIVGSTRAAIAQPYESPIVSARQYVADINRQKQIQQQSQIPAYVQNMGTYANQPKQPTGQTGAMNVYGTPQAGNILSYGDYTGWVAPKPTPKDEGKTPKGEEPKGEEPKGEDPFAFSPFEMSQYGGFQWDINMPGLPTPYQLTPEDIARFYNQSTLEANQLFDPQIMEIANVLQKNLLQGQSAKTALEQPYEELLTTIDKWQKKTTEEETRRWFARGLGAGGGLIKAETEIAGQALEQKTSALKEKATKIGEIESQMTGLTQEAGAKTEQAKKSKSEYIVTRANELADTYQNNQNALAQKQFENSMLVQQFGLTVEAQRFGQWLDTMSVANDLWYKNSQIALEKMSMQLAENARKESMALASKSSGLSEYDKAIQDLKIQKEKADIAETEANTKAILAGIGAGNVTTVWQNLDPVTKLQYYNAANTLAEQTAGQPVYATSSGLVPQGLAKLSQIDLWSAMGKKQGG